MKIEKSNIIALKKWVFVRLQNELISILKDKNYKSLSEFRGKLKNIEK